jgi:hypothetical protein
MHEAEFQSHHSSLSIQSSGLKNEIKKSVRVCVCDRERKREREREGEGVGASNSTLFISFHHVFSPMSWNACHIFFE